MKEDWIDIKLGKALIIERGGSPRPIKEFITNDADGINWIKIGDTKVNSKYITNTTEKIKPDGLKKSRFVTKGDLLLSNSMSFGRPYILDTEGAIHDGWLVLRNATDFEIYSEFLYYVLSSPIVFAQFDKLATGSTVRNLNTGLVARVVAPIAPLPIQRAIVTKIENLFTSLDKGIADLKKVQEQLKIYRQAVLKKAFEGDYPSKKVIEFADVKTGSTPKRGNSRFWENGTIPWVTSGALNNTFVNNADELITETALQETNCKIIPKGSLLVAMYGEGKTRGKCSELNIDAATNQAIATITMNDEYKESKAYVKWFFVKNYEDIRLLSSGGVQPNLNLSIVKNTVLPFPNPEIQKQIIKEIETRLSVCDKVEQNISEALEKAEALRQSILKKAFEGKLLSEAEINKCKQEADYEPASVLLKRIKGIEVEKPQKKSTKQKTEKKKTATPKISKDIQAGVIAKVIKLHEDNPKYLGNLSHVKCEKISHLAEYHIQIALGRMPVKDAAGPDDFSHLKKVEHRAKMTGYFIIKKQEIGHTYESGRNIKKAIGNLENKISTEQVEQLDKLINLFLQFDLERAEIVATVYAGWNNLLLDGKTPTDDEIVYESRENWSKRKLKIERERFYKALAWMRKPEVAIIPQGNGLRVNKPEKKK